MKGGKQPKMINLTPEGIRKYRGNENLTDEELEQLTKSFEEFCQIAFELFLKEQSKLKEKSTAVD